MARTNRTAGYATIPTNTGDVVTRTTRHGPAVAAYVVGILRPGRRPTVRLVYSPVTGALTGRVESNSHGWAAVGRRGQRLTAPTDLGRAVAACTRITTYRPDLAIDHLWSQP